MTTTADTRVDHGPLGRAARLLDAANRAPLRFSEAQDLLGGLAPSSLNRLLKGMLALAMLERTEDGAYAPGARLVRWHRSTDTTLHMLARPLLSELRDDLKASVLLVVRSGDELMCLDRCTDESSPALMPPGRLRPIILTTLAAPLFMDPDTLSDERVLRQQLDQRGATTPMAGVRRVLAHVRRTGWYDDLTVYQPQIRRLAVPIHHDGTVIAALGLGCFARRLRDRGEREAMIARLRDAARRIDRGLVTGV